ncbi:MAG: hypothetical protein M1834_001126 [Cirrosporium novae-zelandiae]|nr:MAG: hypothetical protein M1834_001126 [Cirrosporium novae-zelandiae]
MDKLRELLLSASFIMLRNVPALIVLDGWWWCDIYIPLDIDDLRSLLEDDEPRVIILNQEYSFVGSEGTTTADGCRPDSNTCADDGVTYDNAALDYIYVKSNKTLIGEGDAEIVNGTGLYLQGGVENVIIQNVWLTNVNPEQFIVTGYDAAGRVTISNNEFDGITSWLASCNHEHYWTMLFLGADDQITLANNYIHDTSGRSPKVGGSGSITMHAVNNYWQNNLGHAFDIAEGAYVLIEGNVFDNVTTVITDDSASEGGYIFNVPSSSESTCSEYLDRECIDNTYTDSTSPADYSDTDVFGNMTTASSIWEAMAVDEVASYVVENAGIGKLSSSSSSVSISSASAVGLGTSSAASISSTAGITYSATNGYSATGGCILTVTAASASSTGNPSFSTTSQGGPSQQDFNFYGDFQGNFAAHKRRHAVGH